MKSEDTRNLFLAIALSVMVMAGWQYFYAGPLYQREHQAQMEANQANPAAGARSAAERLAGGFPARGAGRRHAARRAGCDNAGEPDGGAWRQTHG